MAHLEEAKRVQALNNRRLSTWQAGPHEEQTGLDRAAKPDSGPEFAAAGAISEQSPRIAIAVKSGHSTWWNEPAIAIELVKLERPSHAQQRWHVKIAQ